jgi:hypothetical protein
MVVLKHTGHETHRGIQQRVFTSYASPHLCSAQLGSFGSWLLTMRRHNPHLVLLVSFPTQLCCGGDHLSIGMHSHLHRPLCCQVICQQCLVETAHAAVGAVVSEETAHAAVVPLVQVVEEKKADHVAYLLDTKGPEIRTAMLRDGKNLELKAGLSTAASAPCTPEIAGYEVHQTVEASRLLLMDVMCDNSRLLTDQDDLARCVQRTTSAAACLVVGGLLDLVA